jgi:hypothetical protein
MKTRSHSHRMILLGTILVVSMACGLFGPTATPVQQPSTIQPTQQPSSTTQTLQPTPDTNVTTDPGADPQCTVLQDLNLRFGPGTAYRPPIRALPANSVVTPLGFAPQGIPGGSWAYVQDPATQDKGWVSAGSQFISCNVELAALPAVAFGTPPPPPLPSSAQSSDPDGNGFCIDASDDIECVGVFSAESLFQFQVIRNGIELGENDGIEQVAFAVKKDGVPVHNIVEVNVLYCVFGGNGPCNSWVVEDGVFKWTQGGTPVEPGEYEMEVFATVNGETSRWAVFFTLTLP